MVLGFVGLAESTYYENVSRPKGDESVEKKPAGRPSPGYSLTYGGKKVSDAEISEWLCELVEGDGFPYGYKKLWACLREDHGLRINKKKVYRLCKDLSILRPQRKRKANRPKKVAKKDVVSAPNQLWEMDVKYGYITGEDRFFFQLSLIDVFDREVVGYHIGLSCTAADASRVLKLGLQKRGLLDGYVMPKIRTDNGPQFISEKFEDLCVQAGVTHERIPVKTPNMNAHVEAFHSILEDECYGRHEFASFKHAYEVVADYMEYYNRRRRHGALRYMSPQAFHDAFMRKAVIAEAFAA
mgnify:CR=1 FL=1